MLDGQAKEALEEETLQAIQFSKDHLKISFHFKRNSKQRRQAQDYCSNKRQEKFGRFK